MVVQDDLYDFAPVSAFTVVSGGSTSDPDGIFFDRGFGFGVDNIGAEFNLSFQAAAVPEPSSLTLLGLGCIGLWSRRRR